MAGSPCNENSILDTPGLPSNRADMRLTILIDELKMAQSFVRKVSEPGEKRILASVVRGDGKGAYLVSRRMQVPVCSRASMPDKS